MALFYQCAIGMGHDKFVTLILGTDEIVVPSLSTPAIVPSENSQIFKQPQAITNSTVARALLA
jgi:hypothetical protein